MSISIRSIIIFLFSYTFINLGVIEIFPFLSALKYVSDILIIILFVSILRKKNKYEFNSPILRQLKIILFSLFFLTLLSYFLHHENFFYYLWGLRNLFKYFIFWYACTLFLKKDDFYLFAKISLIALFINTPIMIYQALNLNLFGDNVGGLWGTITGVNGYTNIHLVLSNIFALVLLSKKRISYFLTACIILCSCIQAAVAELKFFFIEFVILLSLTFIFSKNKIRLLPIISASIFVLSLGFSLLVFLYNNNENFFTFDSLSSYSEESYASHSAGIDRMTALPLIKTMFLTTIDKFLLGIGLGNAEFTILYTPIFMQKFEFLHIYFFSHGMLFLETGLLGLILYYLFFLLPVPYYYRNRTNEDSQTALVLTFLISTFTFYNQSMRLDSALLVFPFLAFPFISSKRLDTNKK